MTSPIVRWGLLGAGGIAKAFAEALPHSKTGRLAAVGSRDGAKAAAFAAPFGPEVRAHGSYEALLADPGVDAIYLATPHPQHARWAIAAARAGKHLLCEKPLTLNHAEAMAVAQAARESGVFLMEAFMYRCHPLTARWLEVVRSGALGRIGLIRATFSFRSEYNPAGRLFSNALGGGGILDVGCYPASIARLAAGAALGKPFADPLRVTGEAVLDPGEGTDLWAAATARFEGGIVAQLAAGVALTQENGLWVHGTEGALHVPSPFVIVREGGKASFFVTREGKTEETVVETDEWLYGLEADAVGAALADGKKESPAMPVADTLGNMAALDAWRESAGFAYRTEAEAFAIPPVHGGLLRKGAAPGPAMRYGTVPGTPFPVSRLVFGCDNQRTNAHATAVWDDFFERGGNAFDTAWIYGGGLQERLLGRWIARRGIRGETAVMVKGAHTPHCYPRDLSRQLLESLDRSGLGHADMYLMHRDNPEVPVGEFVDVLNGHVAAGRIRAFGGSNWTLERLKEANAYAARKGLRPFELVSNNFSLARMVDPVWEGCVSASAPEFKAWLAESGAKLLAWSSQARGFFTDRAGREKTGDRELVRCWYSDDNFERRERTVALAREKSVDPIHIALAYVLEQPFAPFALIGPRVVAETAGTCAGLAVRLTPEELAWLNLEADRR
ncbi:MAG TPA: aldo/keto reductase [Candidatus Methylacidiphilales bacterium]